ncbi:MAG TPA: enoyl-CoA hydratase/isomerase family protein [Candidatus Angelobacter sp.]|nr:enoyl-CoA hydratase/isomerase family protein [Candidatus Angelobacter sp.]
MRVQWAGPAGEPVVTVTLDRPSTRNAQTPSTWRALAAVGDALPSPTRVVVLRGEGTVFSSGIDLRAFTPEGVDGERVLAELAAVDDVAAAEVIAGYQRGFTWWHDRDDVVTIAAVQGAAVGAGFQLALACDLRVCTTAARFAMRETSLGLVPDLGGTYPLVALVGYARALEMCATGRWVDAAEALRLGLATSVVEPEALDDAVAEVTAALLSAPASAVRATKSVLRGALVNDVRGQRRLERETQLPLIRGMIGPA